MARHIVLAALLPAIAAIAQAASGPWTVSIRPDNSFAFDTYTGGKCVLSIDTCGWGPNWSPWFAPSSQAKADRDVLDVSSPLSIGQSHPTFRLQASPDGPRSLVCRYGLKADEDVPVLMDVVTVGAPAESNGAAVLTRSDGTEETTKLPAGISDFGVVKRIRFAGPSWYGSVDLTIDPPLPVTSDGGLRIVLAKDAIAKGEHTATLTWTFPNENRLIVSQEDVLKAAPVLPTAEWFPYNPTYSLGRNAIGMEDWLDKPAGRHGGVRLRDDRFVLEDGTPIKFWGVNLAYNECDPPKAEAEFTAARFAKYGVNAVRLHKFTGAGWEGIGDEQDSTKMKPEGLDRLDYFCSQLAQRGVYYGWSHTYHFKVMPGDRKRLSGFDDLMKHGGDTYGVINWAEDVQDLLIERVVNLLKHKNPYTGKTYAKDPALCYIELQNEDDIFFYTSSGAYDGYPTYAKQLRARFAAWLQAKYGSQESLAGAWDGALKPGETLASATISLEMNPWFMGVGLPKEKSPGRQRLLDNAEFLHAVQDKFYGRYVKAIRDAGYAGPLVGSPWQTGGGITQYYNLRSDSEVGYVDRHNYFGEKLRDSMLAAPGSGYLSSGLEQVKNRPFGLSEWIHVYPSLFSVEGPIIVAAYGMGLQGWSASYEFQSTAQRLSAKDAIVGNQPFGVWNANAPSQIGMYPILARMVMRGDVRTAPVISTRRVSMRDLQNGELNFSENVSQNGDVKKYAGAVPPETLAVGRALVEFVDKSAPSSFPKLTEHRHGTELASTTGQLKWDTAGGGFITIDTPGTQGYVGFAKGKNLEFGNVAIRPASPYAAVLITAADPKASLSSGKRVLIAAFSRNANTGFRMFTLDEKTIVDNGHSPILLEPVKAEIAFKNRQIRQVNILDHDGIRTGRTLPVKNGRFVIDGKNDHTLYYEVLLQ
jgi:hypothetical protein